MPVVGVLVPATGGGWMVLAPPECPAGHPLGPRRVEVGHQACSCSSGHTTWRCLACQATIYAPALAETCTVLAGPATVRNL
jgi:hypothetical protein